jgi:hypothetical protein
LAAVTGQTFAAAMGAKPTRLRGLETAGELRCVKLNSSRTESCSERGGWWSEPVPGPEGIRERAVTGPDGMRETRAHSEADGKRESAATGPDGTRESPATGADGTRETELTPENWRESSDQPGKEGSECDGVAE